MYLIVNYKTYPSSSGENAVKLTEAIAAAAANHPDVTVVVCPQAADIYRVRERFPHLQIWAQHIDPITPGRNTGWTAPDTMVMAGANGTLINHSEHATPDIATARSHAQTVGLQSCVCVGEPNQAQMVVATAPEFIAFEPPELISTGQSIMSVDASVAQNFLSQLTSFTGGKILGAGVSTAADIKAAIELGFNGVLVASAITTAADPTAKVQELLEGFAQT